MTLCTFDMLPIFRTVHTMCDVYLIIVHTSYNIISTLI